ncbi:MAG: hypothetical protein ACRBF0_11995 [Calditrichia bacterium]
MNSQFLRQLLLGSSGRFLRWSKQLHGAADNPDLSAEVFQSAREEYLFDAARQVFISPLLCQLCSFAF